MNTTHTSASGRAPVPEGLPPDMPPRQRRPARMKRVAERRLAGTTVVLDGVHDPHNISAVLRSCDSFGVQHVHLIGGPEDLRPNRLITRGCERWLTLHYHPDAVTCAAALHAQGFDLWAAVPNREEKTLEQIDFSRNVAFLFGAERNGLSARLLACCDGRYLIPMAGFSQSLNVSVAAAISLYIGTRARRRALGRATDLTDDEIESLAQTWIDADKARKRRAPLNPEP